MSYVTFIVASRSTRCEPETKESFEPGRLESFKDERRPLARGEATSVAEGLDRCDCRRAASSPSLSSLLGVRSGRTSVSAEAVKRALSIWLSRARTLRSAYLEETETGESNLEEGLGEFEFVLGLESLLWGPAWWLWLLPMLSRLEMWCWRATTLSAV